MRTRMPPLCVVALLPAVIACATAGPSRPLNLEPAAPGETIAIPFDFKKRGDTSTATRVTIGDRNAPVLRSEPGRVIVYVPRLAPGEFPVRVYDGKTGIASGRIEIAAPLYRSFVFAREGEGIEVLRVKSTSSEPTRNVRSLGARLSFDLVDGSGRLLYSTSVLDPSETLAESFTPVRKGGPRSLGRTPVEHRSVFPVQLPALPAAEELRVYHARAGLDIFNREGREQRTLLRRFALEQGEWAQ